MTAPERPTGHDLQRAILGEDPALTAEEVADASGATLGEAHRLWRALGFPDAGDSQRAFTESDVRAIADVHALGARGALDDDTLVKMTRAVGQLMSRLAEWEVALLMPSIESVPVGQRTRRAIQMVDDVGDHWESLLLYAWRRHLAAAAARVEVLGSNDEDLQISQATVGFADLVSFSELTNAQALDETGDLVEIFETRCHDVVADHGGRVVKTLGDSVLFVTESPTEGIDTALDIVAVIGGDARLPDVRLGLATGSVVLRMGDVYGPAVNFASRLTSLARRNRVIIDQVTADLLPPEDFETRRLPARPVRGFGEVEPLAVRRTRSRHAF